jgi:hypothetical protein
MDPALGRWTQQDRLDSPGDLREGNRYLYTGDDPINFVDPSELLRCVVSGRFCKRFTRNVLIGVGGGFAARAAGCAFTGVGAPFSPASAGAGAVTGGVGAGTVTVLESVAHAIGL